MIKINLSFTKCYIGNAQKSMIIKDKNEMKCNRSPGLMTLKVYLKGGGRSLEMHTVHWNAQCPVERGDYKSIEVESLLDASQMIISYTQIPAPSLLLPMQ